LLDYATKSGLGYGWKSRLARKCGVTPAHINNWLNLGREPDLKTALRVATALGWDFDRARPDYVPDVKRADICAKVKAGTAEFVEEAPLAFDALDNYFKRSRYAVYTRGGQCYVGVDGDSMSPDYPDGSAIVCAAWNGDTLPHYTPVIARVDGNAYTFKLWTIDDKGEQVVLVPINHAHQPIVGTLSQITPYLVVLGVAIIERKEHHHGK